MYEHQCECGHIFYDHNYKPISCPYCHRKYKETLTEEGRFIQVNITTNYVD